MNKLLFPFKLSSLVFSKHSTCFYATVSFIKPYRHPVYNYALYLGKVLWKRRYVFKAPSNQYIALKCHFLLSHQSLTTDYYNHSVSPQTKPQLTLVCSSILPSTAYFRTNFGFYKVFCLPREISVPSAHTHLDLSGRLPSAHAGVDLPSKYTK